MFDGSGMMSPGMGIFMLLFWGVVIIGIVLAVRWLAGQGRSGHVDGADKAPLDILKQRYARGEITREEFERMKKDLE